MKNKYKWGYCEGKKRTIHRMLMEEKLGRKLELWEHVYFLDSDPKNLNIDNLILIKKKWNNGTKPKTD